MKKTSYFVLILIIILILNVLRMLGLYGLLWPSDNAIKIYLVICVIIGIPGGIQWRKFSVGVEKFENRFNRKYKQDTGVTDLFLTFFSMIAVASVLFLMGGFCIVLAILLLNLLIIISLVLLIGYVLVLLISLKFVVENHYERKKCEKEIRHQEDIEIEKRKRIEEERSGYVQ